MSWCMNDAYQPQQHCYFKHKRWWFSCITNGISKSDALNLLQNANLAEVREALLNKKKLRNLLPYMNWVKKL